LPVGEQHPGPLQFDFLNVVVDDDANEEGGNEEGADEDVDDDKD
jgi:hypothetical protein